MGIQLARQRGHALAHLRTWSAKIAPDWALLGRHMTSSAIPWRRNWMSVPGWRRDRPGKPHSMHQSIHRADSEDDDPPNVLTSVHIAITERDILQIVPSGDELAELQMP